MNHTKPIYTEKNDCQDCYKCVRECPVKAIKIEDGSASIIEDLCIFCGHCTEICPVGAKKIRNDLSFAKLIVNRNERVVASIAPSWIADFPGVTEEQLVGALKLLGFSAVSETSLGAEVVSEETSRLLKETGWNKRVAISTACPAVVELIAKYHAEYIPFLTPLISPMLVHGRLLKGWYGDDTRVIFFGPCVAKKVESDENRNIVDVALTFRDLAQWLDDEGVEFGMDLPNASENHCFEPFRSGVGSLYPIDGGMIAGVKKDATVTDISFMTFSGTAAINEALKGIEGYSGCSTLFLELLACSGGCISGPGTHCKESLAVKRYRVINYRHRSPNQNINPSKSNLRLDSISRKFEGIKPCPKQRYSSREIAEALSAVGKLSSRDELNCGGCGYDSCKEFAIAMILGKAERSMCVSYMRKVAHDKATVLLQKIPSGVVIVDDKMRVVESNFNFAQMLGPEVEMIYEANPGLEGALVEKLIPFHKMLRSALNTGEDQLERDVKVGSKKLKVSVFNVQKHKIVSAVVRDLTIPEVRNDEIARRTRDVIKENLETVQKIAYLLGENASRTEVVLSSILETLSTDED